MGNSIQEEKEFFHKILCDTESSYGHFIDIDRHLLWEMSLKFSESYAHLAERMSRDLNYSVFYNKKNVSLSFVRFIHSLFCYRETKGNLNPVQVAGSLAYWLLRYPCIYPVKPDEEIGFINEKFAFFVSMGFLQTFANEKINIDADFLEGIFHEFSHHPTLSPESISLLFEMLLTDKTQMIQDELFLEEFIGNHVNSIIENLNNLPHDDISAMTQECFDVKREAYDSICDSLIRDIQLHKQEHKK